MNTLFWNEMEFWTNLQNPGFPTQELLASPIDVRVAQAVARCDSEISLSLPSALAVETQTNQIAQAVIPATTPVAATHGRKITGKRKSPDEKKEVRRQQSRLSSRLYRARQKTRQEELEKVNAELVAQVERLIAENARLKSLLGIKEAEMA